MIQPLTPSSCLSRYPLFIVAPEATTKHRHCLLKFSTGECSRMLAVTCLHNPLCSTAWLTGSLCGCRCLCLWAASVTCATEVQGQAPEPWLGHCLHPLALFQDVHPVCESPGNGHPGALRPFRRCAVLGILGLSRCFRASCGHCASCKCMPGCLPAAQEPTA